MKTNMIKWVAGACMATVVAFSGMVMAAEPAAPAGQAAAAHHKAKHTASKKHVAKKPIAKKHHAVKTEAPAAK